MELQKQIKLILGHRLEEAKKLLEKLPDDRIWTYKETTRLGSILSGLYLMMKEGEK